MDKIEKALSRLSAFEKEKIKEILIRLESGHLSSLDIKKLKGRTDIFRVRKGKLRIIYRVGGVGEISILTVERRSDNTYRNI